MRKPTISIEDLSLLTGVFLSVGAAPAVAALLAANCAGCERDGAISHGVFRIPGYLSSIASGWVDPAAQPAMESVDAMNGFAQSALDLAGAPLREKARQDGVALLSVRNSHHFSALWPDVEPFSLEGFLALSMVNSCLYPAL